MPAAGAADHKARGENCRRPCQRTKRFVRRALENQGGVMRFRWSSSKKKFLFYAIASFAKFQNSPPPFSPRLTPSIRRRCRVHQHRDFLAPLPSPRRLLNPPRKLPPTGDKGSAIGSPAVGIPGSRKTVERPLIDQRPFPKRARWTHLFPLRPRTHRDRPHRPRQNR